jgi:hypothetical protein
MYGIKELWNWNYIVRSKRAKKKKKSRARVMDTTFHLLYRDMSLLLDMMEAKISQMEMILGKHPAPEGYIQRVYAPKTIEFPDYPKYLKRKYCRKPKDTKNHFYVKILESDCHVDFT